MHSPRFAAISTPKQQDQYKLLLNRSTRRADDDNLREYYLLTGNKNGRTESMDAVELNWEHQWHNKHRSSVSLFFNDYDLVGWDGSAQQINRIGNLKTLGLELEGHLKFERQSLSILYCYVAEEDFTLAEAGVRQFISASVYGYGSDLANWAKHTLKFIYLTQMNKHWEYFSSLRMLMDLSGSEAMADYNLIENNNSVSSLPRARILVRVETIVSLQL